MGLRIAFQMDPLANINIDEDTTFRIAEEAQKREHSLFHFLPENLEFDENDVVAWGQDLRVSRKLGEHFKLGCKRRVSLGADFDIIWLRQDPPFDMAYITTTHLLDLLKDKAMVVNDPFWVRNYPEKLLVLNFQQFIPPTIISRSIYSFKKFREKHGDSVIKPLYGNGGSGIFKMSKLDTNLSSLVEFYRNVSAEPIIMQKYIPAVRSGDKRVILINGDPVGAINRVPASGEIRSNMHVGGMAERTNLTDRDLQICDAVGELMKEKGQILVGIDIIGDFLTEINLTSPTGVQELEKFNNINIAEKIWECLEGYQK